MAENKNRLNRCQQLKTLLNDAKWLLLLISTLAVFVELTRLMFSKNGDNTHKEGRKREVALKTRAH